MHPWQATRRPHWSLARTWLLQPGTPEGHDTFDAAVAGDADVVVLDVEDGLPDVRKPAGRQSVAEWLFAGGQGWVRINSTTSPFNITQKGEKSDGAEHSHARMTEPTQPALTRA